MLPDWIGVPASIALPFGSFEKVLEDPANSSLREQIRDLCSREPLEKETLLSIRNTIQEMKAPADLRKQLASALAAQGTEAAALQMLSSARLFIKNLARRSS